MKGGQGITNATSGADYGVKINGSLDQQYNRTFSSSTPGPPVYTSTLGQKAGKKRRQSRSKRGGFWGEIINQAIVPFGILGLQQSYRRKKGGANKTRKN
jgi:hypothetical protein